MPDRTDKNVRPQARVAFEIARGAALPLQALLLQGLPGVNSRSLLASRSTRSWSAHLARGALLCWGAASVGLWPALSRAQSTAPNTRQDEQSHGPPRKQADRQGAYVQARALGLFGVNMVHGYLEDCPGHPCELTKPIGGALGLGIGYEWDGLALEGWGLLLMDLAPTSYTSRRRVPAPSAAEANGDADGSIIGDVDIDFEIGPDGISIGGGVDAAGDTEGQAAAERPTVIQQRPADALLMRYGAGLGLGLRGLWGSRPARLSAALSAGILRRGVLDVSEFWDSEARAYTAPLLMLDAGVYLGKTASVYLGLFGMAEFTGNVVLDDVAGHAQVVVNSEPQVYVGPLLALQWGPTRDD